MRKGIEHFVGCMIGGAVGDALGAPVEFLNYEDIITEYGQQGISGYVYAKGSRKAYITDDTQLSLFTAEGLLRSVTRASRQQVQRTVKDTAITIFRSYLRWLYTQGLTVPRWAKKDYDGWLVKLHPLHAYREPGVTCITSLGRGIMGTIQKPINDSKGCGGVMRVAPIGLVENKENVFELGCAAAAITHGHPAGYLPAGTLALIIYELRMGASLVEAIHKALECLRTYEHSRECVVLIEHAIDLASKGKPSYDKIESLGKGVMGDQALAMAIYATLSYPNDFKKAVLLAVNHSGDSDSVAAVTGNILGTYLGIQGIDEDLVKNVELSEEIKQIAKDLYVLYESSEEWLQKYPAW